MLPQARELNVKYTRKLMDMGYEQMSKGEKQFTYYLLFLEQRDEYLKILEDYAKAGDWEAVCCFISLQPFIMEEGFGLYYDRIPDEMKFDFVTSLYTHNGDGCANIRKALLEIRKYGDPKLPDWVKDKDVITIYRGSNSGIRRAADAISWTTEKDVAEWFANRFIRVGKKGHVYEAKIKVDDILSYTNERLEREVMQYRKVFGVHEIPFEPGRVDRIPE